MHYLEEKRIDTHLKMEWENVFFRESSRGQSIGDELQDQTKNQPERYSLAWSHCCLLILVMAEKWKNTSGHTRLYVRVQPWRNACSVFQLARALVSHCRLINIATFSTQDLREQGYKYYVGNYQANKNLWSQECFLTN